MTSLHAVAFLKATLGTVLVAAGVTKIVTGVAQFERAVADYRLLPGPLVRPLS